MDLEGGCACGAVRYRLRSAPMFVHCCHCRDCQRQTGSAFVLNAIIETNRIDILAGEPEPVAVPTDSGRPHDIYRCPSCRVAVWSDTGTAPAPLRPRRHTRRSRGAEARRPSSPARSSLVPPAGGYAGFRRLLRRQGALAGREPGAPARFAADPDPALMLCVPLTHRRRRRKGQARPRRGRGGETLVTSMLRFFEDFPVGWSDTFGPISVTKDDIVSFAREYDAQPFHTDEEAAKSTFVGALIASGWHTCALNMRLVAEGLLLNATSMGAPGVEEVVSSGASGRSPAEPRHRDRLAHLEEPTRDRVSPFPVRDAEPTGRDRARPVELGHVRPARPPWPPAPGAGLSRRAH